MTTDDSVPSPTFCTRSRHISTSWRLVLEVLLLQVVVLFCWWWRVGGSFIVFGGVLLC